jgi:hypothetical protein
MKIDENSLKNIISLLFMALLFIFAFTWIVFDFQESASSIKDSWAIVASVFGGFSTLTAAYVAYSLYDDWKKPHNLNIENEHKQEILKIIRKITPLEYKYDRLVSNYYHYHNQPDRIMPIDIKNKDLDELTSYINELLGLLEELFFITQDKKITDLKNHYYHYAQLYNYILSRSNYLFKEGNKKELLEFLGEKLEFDFIKDENEYTNFTFYAYAFRGLNNVGLRKYISESLKYVEQ